MATLDQGLGNAQQNPGQATHQLTTANAVASGALIVVGIWYFIGASTPTITLSGGGLSGWAIDAQFEVSGNYGIAIGSVQAPAGLAISTNLQAAYSVTPGESYLSAVSLLGMATSSPKDVASPGAGNTPAAVTWSAGNITPTVNDVIIACGLGSVGAGTATPSTGFTDVPGAAGDWLASSAGVNGEMTYKLDALASTLYTPGGTFSDATTANWYGLAVGYKLASGGPTKTGAGVIGP